MTIFAIAFSILLLRERYQLEEIQKTEVAVIENISSLANRLANNHVKFYELMLTAEKSIDEGKFYETGKSYLYEIHSVENELERLLSKNILDASIVAAAKSVIKRITDYRIKTANAVLMATVNMSLAKSVLSTATQLFNILNVEFLHLNTLMQTEIQAKFKRHQLNIDRIISAFALLVVLIASGMLIYIVVSSRYLARDLGSVIAKLGGMVSQSTADHPDTDKSRNEVAILSQVVKDVEKSHRLLKETQEQLSQKEARLRAIFDNMIGAIITTDESGKIDSFNAMAEIIFGYSEKEAIGKNIDELIPNRAANFKSKKRTNSPSPADQDNGGDIDEAKGRRKDGSLFPIKSNVTEYMIGDSKMSVELLQDVTELKEAEQKLRQFQRMEAIGQLTGGIAHDFNNLLGVMMGNAELIEGNVTANKDVMARVENLKKAIDRGSSLTERLLAYSRKQTLRPTAVSVVQLLDGMADLMARSLTAAIETTIETQPDLWLAQVDEHQLEDAVLNLAINARDAMPQGGKLMIKACNFTLGSDIPSLLDGMNPGQYVEISVSDTGVGMSSKLQLKVFEPFFTTKDVGQGSGLGLSMVYGFIKQSQGHVYIDSEVNKGTTLYLYLPRSSIPSEAKIEPHVKIHTEPASETILLVEDNTELRRTTRERLNILGYKIIEAIDGKTAIAVLEENDNIDLLLTDVILPSGMNGIDISVKASYIQPGIPVLFMSGHTREALTDVGMAEEHLHILQKPFRSIELANKIRVALNR